MPKAAVPRKFTVTSGAPANVTVKYKSINRGRNQVGRATASNVKTTVKVLPPEPTPVPPSFEPDPVDPDSEEEEIQLITPKGPSRAVSVSLYTAHDVESH